MTAARTSYRTRRRSCKTFQNKPSRIASSDRRNAGLSVWSHKGYTLKGIRYCNHPDTEIFFPALGRILFGQNSYIYIYNQCTCSVQTHGITHVNIRSSFCAVNFILPPADKSVPNLRAVHRRSSGPVIAFRLLSGFAYSACVHNVPSVHKISPGDGTAAPFMCELAGNLALQPSGHYM